MQFGTRFDAGWGNEIPNIYYRVRAVSVDNVRGLPSPTLNVRSPTPRRSRRARRRSRPSAGATVSLPFTFDWTDTPNPQIVGYDLDVDDEPNFEGDVRRAAVQDISRSDYMLVSDLAPGTYFWRVRALHGAVVGPWSAGASFRVVASPPTPPGLDLFWIITEPGSVVGRRVDAGARHAEQAGAARRRDGRRSPATCRTRKCRRASSSPRARPMRRSLRSRRCPVPGDRRHASARPTEAAGSRARSGFFPILFSLSLNTDSVSAGPR